MQLRATGTKYLYLQGAESVYWNGKQFGETTEKSKTTYTYHATNMPPEPEVRMGREALGTLEDATFLPFSDVPHVSSPKSGYIWQHCGRGGTAGAIE